MLFESRHRVSSLVLGAVALAVFYSWPKYAVEAEYSNVGIQLLILLLVLSGVQFVCTVREQLFYVVIRL